MIIFIITEILIKQKKKVKIPSVNNYNYKVLSFRNINESFLNLCNYYWLTLFCMQIIYKDKKLEVN